MDATDLHSEDWATGAGDDFTRYRVLQHVAAIPGEVFIKNDRGATAFEIDGGARATEDVIRVRDLTGHDTCLIRGSALRSGGTVKIVDPDAMTLATIERVELSPVRDQFSVRVGSGTTWTVEGLVTDYEYWIRDRDGEIAHISRRWFRARDSYGVQVASGQCDLVVLAVAVCLDYLVHDSN